MACGLYLWKRESSQKMSWNRHHRAVLSGEDYTYVPGEEIHRQYEDILLEEDLRTFISSHYGSAGLTDVEMQKIVNKLSLIPATPIYESNREAFRLVNEGFDLVRDDLSQVALHVEYIDYDQPENNIFKVVNQYSVQGERSADRICLSSSMVFRSASVNLRLLLTKIPLSTMLGNR